MDNQTGLALLRQPFPANQISKLPKPTKRDAPKGKCAECGGWHGLPALHLDYVGHAALTDRLLDADPGWTWEPLSVVDGLPLLDGFGGMWIRLTVCGVTRMGYGHAGEKSGGDAIKEVIGDALRNAAMRFGAALDLWHKGELHAEEPSLVPALEASIEKAKTSRRIVPTAGAGDGLEPARKNELEEMALYMIDGHKDGKDQPAIDLWYAADSFKDNEERVYLWSLLQTESKLRSTIKANRPVEAVNT